MTQKAMNQLEGRKSFLAATFVIAGQGTRVGQFTITAGQQEETGQQGTLYKVSICNMIGMSTHALSCSVVYFTAH